MGMKRKEKVSIMKNIALITQIGVTIISTILVALFIGKKLDEWLGTGVIFTLIFLLLGIATSFMTILRLGLKEENKPIEDWGEEDEDEDDDPNF
jgi:F0F1-type ATP synthase assembly protein I